MITHTHEMETVYVNGRRTIYVSCNGTRIGGIQGRRDVQAGQAWNPVAGESPLTGDMPLASDRTFPTPYVQVALAWIEERSNCHDVALLA